MKTKFYNSMFSNKIKIACFVPLFCILCTAWGQKLTSSYIPTLITDSISTVQYDEVNPIYSAETKTLYFTRTNHPENKFGTKGSQDVWSSQLQKDSSWSLPVRLTEQVNNSRYNNVLSVLDKGQTLLISGVYTKKGVWYKRGLSTVSKQGTDQWTTPETVKIPGFQNVNDGRVLHAFMNQKQTVIMFSFDKQHLGRKNNLFVSLKKKKGKWSRPKVLSVVDKASTHETCPWLSQNGDTLFYASKRSGNLDIYQSSIDSSGKKYLDWGKPTLLALNGINSEKNESFGSLNNVNDIAFFASDREGSWDIYKVRRFENNPYILISGTIFNQFRNAPIDVKCNATLVLKELVKNGEKIDTVLFQPDSMVFDTTNATYSFRVPFNKDIVMEAQAESFINEPITISTGGRYQYGEKVQNVNLQPLLYADLSGVIIDSLTNEKSPINIRELNPQIYVSDLSYPDAVIDSLAIYKGIRLALGFRYGIYAKVDGYDGVVDTLDLTSFDSYIDTSMTLLINKQPDPFMYIKGVFISSKDSTKVSGETVIYVNNKKQATDLIDESNFHLKVSLNDTNSFKVHMHGYLDFHDTLFFAGTDHLDTTLVVALTPIEDGMKMVIDHIYFATGKAVLKGNSIPALDLLVAFMNEYPEISIEIVGHTDNVGSEKYNAKLSDRRAKAVGDFLIKNGISQDRILSKGLGFAEPLVKNDSEENRAKNRRVEFVITRK